METLRRYVQNKRWALGISQEEMSRRSGVGPDGAPVVSKAYIGQIELGATKRPRPDKLRGIAVALGVAFEDVARVIGYGAAERSGEPAPTMLKVLSDPAIDYVTTELQKSVEGLRTVLAGSKLADILDHSKIDFGVMQPLRMIPLVEQSVAAWDWGDVHMEYYPYSTGEDGRYLAIRVSGDCMRPKIETDDVVIVRLDAEAHVQDVVVVEEAGQWTLKRLLSNGAGQWKLAPDNPAFSPPRPVGEGGHVIGVVVKVITDKGKP